MHDNNQHLNPFLSLIISWIFAGFTWMTAFIGGIMIEDIKTILAILSTSISIIAGVVTIYKQLKNKRTRSKKE